MVDIATIGIAADTRDLKTVGAELDRLGVKGDQAERKLGRATKGMEKDFQGLNKAIGLAVAALAGFSVAGVARNILETNRETQRLQASLVTMTGSLNGASAAWAQLDAFASTTPFTLDQSINGFVKMKALGLDPTTSALTSFGNTAAAMGKDLNQMIEAVADASTSEFERLKEFGIKAKQEGDRVSLTFQGVTTEIGNNANEIVGYLEGIGNTKFAGAMERQMDTLNGQISNLDDNVDRFFRTIGESGFNVFASAAIGSISETFQEATEGITEYESEITFAVDVVGGSVALLADGFATSFGFIGDILETNMKSVGAFAAAIGFAAKGDLEGAKQVYKLFAEDTRAEFAETATSTDSFRSSLARLRAEAEKARSSAGDSADLSKKTTSETNSQTKATDKLTEALERNRKALADKERSLESEILNMKIQVGLIKAGVDAREAATRADLISAGVSDDLIEKYIAMQRELGKLTDSAKKHGDQAEPFAKAWEEATFRIDEAFADAFKGAFDSFDEFSDRLEDAFKTLLAELAYQAAKQEILVRFGVSGSGSSLIGGGSAGAGGGSMGGLGDLLGLFGGGAGTANTPGFTQAFIKGGLQTVAAGYAGGQIGQSVGSSLTGREAGSQWGTAIGTAIGTAFGVPFIGAAVGGLVDSVFGGRNWKTKASGIELGRLDGGFAFGSFADKESSGLLGSSSKTSRETFFGTGAGQNFIDQYFDLQATVSETFSRLGVDAAMQLEQGFTTGLDRIDTAGKSQEQINALIQDWFGGVADEMTAFVDSSIGSFDRLIMLADQLEFVNRNSRYLEGALFDVSKAGAMAADEFARLSGGFDEVVFSVTRQRRMLIAQSIQAANALERERKERESLIQTATQQFNDVYSRERAELERTADAFGNLGGTLRDFRSEIMGFAETAEQSAERAGRAFQSAANRAALGDQTAMAQLPGLGRAFAESLTESATSRVDLQRQLAGIRRATDAALATAERQSQNATRQIAFMDGTLAVLNRITGGQFGASATGLANPVQQSFIQAGNSLFETLFPSRLMDGVVRNDLGLSFGSLVDQSSLLVGSAATRLLAGEPVPGQQIGDLQQGFSADLFSGIPSLQQATQANSEEIKQLRLELRESNSRSVELNQRLLDLFERFDDGDALAIREVS